MVSNTLNHSGKPAALVFNKVGENLYRLESSGRYYGLLKRAGKQFRRSLTTTERKLAERRPAGLHKQIGNLSLSEIVRIRKISTWPACRRIAPSALNLPAHPSPLVGPHLRHGLP